MLQVPLSQRQIAVAVHIRRELSMWSAADDALDLLSERMPTFGLPETMLKTAAINQLYGTNLYAVNRMAAHITQIMQGAIREAGPALVEKMACVPVQEGQQSYRHFSFASKFCHFFVNKEACPIFDRYAAWTVQYHLGRSRLRDAERPYRAFVSNTQRLLRESGLRASSTELDSYLWIRGAYAAWSKKPDMQLNADLKGFFKKNKGRRQVKALLD